MNKVRVLFFATLSDYTNQRQVEMELPDNLNVSEFRQVIVKKFPNLLVPIRTSLIAINKEYAFDEDLIVQDAEIAIFPPVSGGSGSAPTITKITTEELDLDELIAQITLDTTGAACIFTGMVRGITSRDALHETLYLEYEAYIPMAEAKMHQVVEEIRERWSSVEGIAIIQRIGKLYPHTPTVLIACTAAHRDTGVFEAARYGIDRLKEIVPVWKKEVGSNGEEWVEGDYFPTRGD